MLSKIKSYALNGLYGYPVDIEVDLNSGIPSYDMVGMPDTAVKESRERVRSAIKNSGFKYPMVKITINFAPADIKKEGSVFDLAVAMGLLTATSQIELGEHMQTLFLGELSLDGTIRKINGVLPILISAKQAGFTSAIIPEDNAKEAGYINGMKIYAFPNLKDLINKLSGKEELIPIKQSEYVLDSESVNSYGEDFCNVKGQRLAKRALEIAAAGGHNVIMCGPPGSGKTMLSRCVPGILPPMSFEEALEVTKIHSIAGLLDNNVGIVKTRPFRSPHHTITIPALAGGGKYAHPGEISLAHNGVLFLDELPEYPRHTLETLRQPLEDKVITISRSMLTVEYPANFILIASMNPCPCGNYGSQDRVCKCSPNQIHNYLNKLSGPLMDRIDLHVEVDNVKYSELSDSLEAETSAVIRKRVENARTIQMDRFKDYGIYTNSQMTSVHLKKFCKLDSDSELILELAYKKYALTARGVNRILKVARTIADIENCKNIETTHIAEAIQFRNTEKISGGKNIV